MFTINDSVIVKSVVTNGSVYVFESSSSFVKNNDSFTLIFTIAGIVLLFVAIIFVVNKVFK